MTKLTQTEITRMNELRVIRYDRDPTDAEQGEQIELNRRFTRVNLRQSAHADDYSGATYQPRNG